LILSMGGRRLAAMRGLAKREKRTKRDNAETQSALGRRREEGVQQVGAGFHRIRYLRKYLRIMRKSTESERGFAGCHERKVWAEVESKPAPLKNQMPRWATRHNWVSARA
jgi:hypothetical protein